MKKQDFHYIAATTAISLVIIVFFTWLTIMLFTADTAVTNCVRVDCDSRNNCKYAPVI